MSSDEEDLIMLYNYIQRRRRRRRKKWIHQYIKKNVNCRLFVAARELNENDSVFKSCYRMSKKSYRNLVKIIGPFIQKQDTNMRQYVSPEERILITLRYLATGCPFRALALYFARGECTISRIIAETTQVIWDALKENYMAVPTEDKWKRIARRYFELWNIPNCLGAIDGKHIRIQKFPNTGSANYNFKGYHSIILLGCCDADGYFITIECGFAGRNSDGGVFRVSALGQWLERDGLNIPTTSPLPYDETGNEFPYYFVGDNAFPLKRHLMRPYGSRNLNNVKRIFNYRLSRGRKSIECVFGMMTQKFQVLLKSITCRKYETIISIVKCACILHNYIRKNDGVPYTTNEDNNINFARARNIPNLQPNMNFVPSPLHLRNYLANYFLQPNVALPWQWNYCINNE